MPALESLIQRQERAHPIRIHTAFAYTAGHLTIKQELNILRIVQEALSNAIRHGDSTQALIHITSEQANGQPTGIRLQIRDNGRGFHASQPVGCGWGLKNMQKRAEQLGTTLHIHSLPGIETTVELAIPLHSW